MLVSAPRIFSTVSSSRALAAEATASRPCLRMSAEITLSTPLAGTLSLMRLPGLARSAEGHRESRSSGRWPFGAADAAGGAFVSTAFVPTATGRGRSTTGCTSPG